ncbi:hypothetical protein ACH4MN_30405 [Streptomyces anulatus]|uniref:hypothetical protein n=1 Tax=Streptomyces sp. C3-3 TaxID=2824901 RepID=UPI001B370AFC|nr:hypothetical protein [Streptomyces sp. C3-3]MBQ1113056.1 hypothetical protein [Streptomyces sp. C3-3]
MAQLESGAVASGCGGTMCRTKTARDKQNTPAGQPRCQEEDLKDLVELARRAVDCAAADHWEGALSIAANVTNTPVGQHAIAWYQDEFGSTRNAQNMPITGVKGPGATIDYVVTNIPLPERTVGVFELRAHLVVRPLSSTFQQTSAGNDTFNRNAVAHPSSYDSYREEFTVPALLTMHSLLRGLDEKPTVAERVAGAT